MEEKKLNAPAQTQVGQETKSISFLFHLITITITICITFTSIRITVEQPTPAEELLLIKSISPKMLSDSAVSPVTVRTGLSIFKYREFDMVNNDFIFEGTIWFDFDPSIVSIETVSHFRFEKGDIISISPPRSHLSGDRLQLFYDIIVRFKTELDYKLFPIDDHMLELVMVNTKVTPHNLIFEADGQSFIVAPNTESYGWIEATHEVTTGYSKQIIDTREPSLDIERPAIQFSILYRRSGFKYALILLMPLMVFIIIMLTTFSYDPEKYFSSIMVANGASLSGLIAFRFVIENMSPKVGYFMISDYFFLVFLALAAALFLIGIFSLNISMKTKKNLILLVHGLLIASFIAIVSYELSFSYHGTEFF